jgi:hypothetical protein
MKPFSFIRVVRMWYGVHTNPVLRSFDAPEGMNYMELLVDVVPELLSCLTVSDCAPQCRVRI